MGTAFEVALICHIKPSLPDEVIDTLIYMTRSRDYKFETTIDHGFFQPDDDFGDSWRYIISNHDPNVFENEKELFNQVCRSSFEDHRLCFRVLLGDDEFYNTWFLFADLLESMIAVEGLIGYRNDVMCYSQPVLIYFEDGQLIERDILSSEIPSKLIRTIDIALG